MLYHPPSSSLAQGTLSTFWEGGMAAGQGPPLDGEGKPSYRQFPRLRLRCCVASRFERPPSSAVTGGCRQTPRKMRLCCIKLDASAGRNERRAAEGGDADYCKLLTTCCTWRKACPVRRPAVPPYQVCVRAALRAAVPPLAGAFLGGCERGVAAGLRRLFHSA
jgi:hypothetical protein